MGYCPGNILSHYKNNILLDCLYFGLGPTVFPAISIALFSPYYLEPFIHFFPFLFCLSQFSAPPLGSMMNINYVLIYKNSTLIAFDFSLSRPQSFLCLFWFPIIFCEAKSMSPFSHFMFSLFPFATAFSFTSL